MPHVHVPHMPVNDANAIGVETGVGGPIRDQGLHISGT